MLELWGRGRRIVHLVIDRVLRGCNVMWEPNTGKGVGDEGRGRGHSIQSTSDHCLRLAEQICILPTVLTKTTFYTAKHPLITNTQLHRLPLNICYSTTAILPGVPMST